MQVKPTPVTDSKAGVKACEHCGYSLEDCVFVCYKCNKRFCDECYGDENFDAEPNDEWNGYVATSYDVYCKYCIGEPVGAK